MAAGAFRSVDVGGVGRALADALLGGALTRRPVHAGTADDPAAYLSVLYSTLINGIVNRAPPPAPAEHAPPPAPSRGPGPATRAESW